MKRRINLTIDAQLIARTKRLAHQRKTSISQLVETGLRAIHPEENAPHSSFAEQWSGKLKLAPRNPEDPRQNFLWRKYGLGENADSH